MRCQTKFRVADLALLPCVLAILPALPGKSSAALLSFSFSDPIADQTGTIDVTGLVFTFDNATGNYVIEVNASPMHPFAGSFRMNINLYNPSAGVTVDPGFFADTMNDFSLTDPATTVTLSGSNNRLLMWDVGDQVAIGTAAFGNPIDATFTLFGSGVIVFFPLSWDHMGTATSSHNGAATQVAIIANVPEPSSGTIAMVVLTALSLIQWRHRCKCGCDRTVTHLYLGQKGQKTCRRASGTIANPTGSASV